jgi:hypothetical protein
LEGEMMKQPGEQLRDAIAKRAAIRSVTKYEVGKALQEAGVGSESTAYRLLDQFEDPHKYLAVVETVLDTVGLKVVKK